MSKGERLLYLLGPYCAPGLLACYALFGLYRAYIEGGAQVCTAGRYQHCRWVWADMDPDRIQSAITLDWWLLAASVVLTFIIWRAQSRSTNNSSD
jgi:hypothetical protein